MTARAKTPRCRSCRWWERSGSHRSIERDWGLCHFWGGRSGARIKEGFIDYTYGHEPSGSDTCDWHDAAPDKKEEAQLAGKMPVMKCEGTAP